MKNVRAFFIGALILSSCRDITLPPVLPLKAGTIQGSVVYSVPGRSGFRAAGGARLEILGTSIVETAAPETGRFLLENVTSKETQLLITFDSDGDGTVDRQKLIELADLKAGPGRDVLAGEIQLGRNAAVSGKVLRGDNDSPIGHAGTTVFVPRAPFVTISGDDGSFLLSELPEGAVKVAFFRNGFYSQEAEVTLGSGEEARVTSVTMEVAPPNAVEPAELKGNVTLTDGKPSPGAAVRAAADGKEYEARTNDMGEFSLSGLPLGIYQVAVEKEQFRSLRLYNRLLESGDNSLGTLVLTPGESTTVHLDGGVLSVDAGPPPLAARIDHPDIEADFGDAVTLSGVRSSGTAPLEFHWTQLDGGAPAQLTPNDSAQAISTRFTAPSVPSLMRFQLVVSDAVGNRSAPANAVVKVGTKPQAVLSVPANVTSGDTVTIDATSSHSSDNSLITSFRYRQITGPFVPELNGQGLGKFNFVAPSVPGPTPMSFEVIASSAVGRTSAPVTATLILRPRPEWSVGASWRSSIVDGGTVIQMSAVVNNPTPGSTYAFQWSPEYRECSPPDGGNFDCPEAFRLSNPRSAITEFVFPKNLGTTLFIVTATDSVTRVSKTAQVNLQNTDTQRPMCTPYFGRLGFYLDCDEQLMQNTAQITMTPPVRFRMEYRGTSLAAIFEEAPPTASLVQFDVSGVQDLAGNSVSIMVNAASQPPGPRFETSGISKVEPRPGFALLPALDGGAPREFVMGKYSTGSDRAVWSMEMTPNCGPGSCIVDAGISNLIAMPGNDVEGETVFTIGQKIYVALSSDTPIVSIMELNQGKWQELPSAPPFLTAATDGTALFLAARAPAFDAGVPLTFWNGVVWNTDTILPVPGSPLPTYVDLQLTPGNQVLINTPPDGMFIERYLRGASGWAPYDSTSSGYMPLQVQAVSTQATAGLQSIAALLDLGLNLQMLGINISSTKAPVIPVPVEANVEPGLDVEAWGENALVAYSAYGKIFVGVFWARTNEFKKIATEQGDSSWNGGSANGHHPNITLVNGQAVVTWQEMSGDGDWKMAARVLR